MPPSAQPWPPSPRTTPEASFAMPVMPVPTSLRFALVLATANNASVRIDTARRFVPIRIVVDDESPELRPFDFDPVAEAIRDRIELLEAAFTIILAWQRE